MATQTHSLHKHLGINKWVILVTVLLVGLAGAYLLFFSKAATKSLPENGLILVTKNFDIFTYNPQTNDYAPFKPDINTGIPYPFRLSSSMNPVGTEVILASSYQLNTDIYMSDIASGKSKKLISLSKSSNTIRKVYWSPDGSTAFMQVDRSRDGSYFGADIYKITRDGQINKIQKLSKSNDNSKSLMGFLTSYELLFSEKESGERRDTYYVYNFKDDTIKSLIYPNGEYDNSLGTSEWQQFVLGDNRVNRLFTNAYLRSSIYEDNVLYGVTYKYSENDAKNIAEVNAGESCIVKITVENYKFKTLERTHCNNYDSVGFGLDASSHVSPDSKYIYANGNKAIDIKSGQIVKIVDFGYEMNDWQAKLEYFMPNFSTTRQAMAAFLYRLEGRPQTEGVDDVCGKDKSGPFTDVGGNHIFCKEIYWLSKSGITSGYADGSFKPRAAVTRQAMAAFLYRRAGTPDVPTAATKCGAGKPGPFSDVKSTSPFCLAIEWMNAEGISTGYRDGTFRPTSTVSRQAMAAFLYRAEGEPTVEEERQLYVDVKPDHNFYNEIQWLGSLR